MNNNRKILLHSIAGVAVGVCLYAIMFPLIDAPQWCVAVDALVSGSLFALILIPLNAIAEASNKWNLPPNQSVINHAALGIMFATIWIGVEFIIMYLIEPLCAGDIFRGSVGLKIVVALLIYSIAVLTGRNRYLLKMKMENLPYEEPDEKSANSEPAATHITVKKSSGAIEMIGIDHIIHIKAEGDYVMITATTGKHLKEHTMKSLEERLPSSCFVRVHRSHIVNINHITQIELYDKNTRYLTMKNGDRIRTSPNGYATLKNIMEL